VADPKKFRPKVAVEILTEKSSEPADLALKTITLAELVAWCFLDQEGRKKGKPASPNKRRYIRTVAARRTRGIVSAMLFDRHISERGHLNVIRPLLGFIKLTGGLAALTNGRSTKSMLRAIRKTDAQTRYVFEIVRYLVLCQAEPDGTRRATLDNAKKFVAELGPKLGLAPYGLSAISKFWETFAPAAPYIFSFYQEATFSPSSAKDPALVLNWLAAFVNSPDRVSRLLGRAASTLDLLGRSRGQRESDFANVGRHPLNVRPFNQIERAAYDRIVNADPSAPIYEPPYRPRMILPKKRKHVV